MIIHVDMDAFYASVEQRDNPALIGKPVVVGGSADGRGVVATASYEARRFGIHSAMSAAQAVRLCPNAVFIRPRMSHYVDVSRSIRAIFEQYTPVIEPLSLDEAFLDVTGSQSLFGGAVAIGRLIQDRIRSELKLNASVGVAPNKFLAKVASDLQKPNGYVVVDPDHIHEFLDPLPIGRIWGIGKVTGKRFEKLAIQTIGQLRRLSRESLNDLFGSSGDHYWTLSHGIDNRRVIPDREAKSISNETTFATDIDDPETLRSWLVSLVEQVARRMRAHDLRGRTVEVKVRFSDFRTITRSHTLPIASNGTQELLEVGLDLLNNRIPANQLPVRLLGFGVSHIDQGEFAQMSLLDQEETNRHRSLDRVADEIFEKFGRSAIRRGSGKLRKPRDSSS